jgi:hypothetical protein
MLIFFHQTRASSAIVICDRAANKEALAQQAQNLPFKLISSDWILDCIAQFQIVDTEKYVVNI